jgi:phosphoserine phosphatase RsbU/P
MGVFASVVVILWILKWLFFARLIAFFPINVLLDLLLAFIAIYYLWRIRVRLLWKIRRRLILAHVFIGAIPSFIIIGILLVSALLFYYQLSYYLISNQIGLHASQIYAFNLTLKDGIQELIADVSPADSSALKAAIDSHAKYLFANYPSASIIVRYPDPVTHRNVAYGSENRNSGQIKDYKIPEWLEGKDYNGLVVEDMQPQLYSRRLLLRSIVFSDFRANLPFSIEVSVPFDRFFLERLKAAMGQDLLLASNASYDEFRITDISPEKIIDSTFEMGNTPAFESWPWKIFLYPISWANKYEVKNFGESLGVELSTSKLIKNFSRSDNNVANRILQVLEMVIAFFLVMEIVSVVVGILLTRSITNAVHSLDSGTEFVKRGDFSHRIVVRSEDQLGALAASFNQMTEFVQRLVKERVQKERLERELEIAKEVQERLFPAQNPQIGKLAVSGVCLPARVVSGDYYDFLPLGVNQLGLALADICGKGISAALLMSSLQATLRSNVMNLWHQNGLNGERTLAKIVERLNSQIFSYTSANKFATFFYAVYDDRNQTLTYCNAGHNPPLLFSGKDVQRLRTGGTVVGIFADSEYQQETVQIGPGDLLVAYTDGIIESVNEYGEEFGESRLIQLIQKHRDLDADKMKGVIVEQVLSWTFAEERDDDMTLIVAKMSGPTPAGLGGINSSE